MPEEEPLRLVAMAERISLVSAWVERLAEEDFLADLMVGDTAAMSLLVIGETARRRLDKTKAASPEPPWPAIVSPRNRIADG